jgi:hypothetical protein
MRHSRDAGSMTRKSSFLPASFAAAPSGVELGVQASCAIGVECRNPRLEAAVELPNNSGRLALFESEVWLLRRRSGRGLESAGG